MADTPTELELTRGALQREIGRAIAVDAELTRQRQRAEKAEAERDALKAELAEANAAYDGAINARNQLDRENARLIDERDGLRAELAHAKNDVEVGDRMIAHFKSERDTLRHEFEEMTKLHDAKHRDWQRSEAELAEARAAIHEVFDCWADPFGNWTAEQADAARAQKSQMLQRLLAALDAPQRPEDTAQPRHIGGRANAEDCPACHGTNPPYPFICPGEPETED